MTLSDIIDGLRELADELECLQTYDGENPTDALNSARYDCDRLGNGIEEVADKVATGLAALD